MLILHSFKCIVLSCLLLTLVSCGGSSSDNVSNEMASEVLENAGGASTEDASAETANEQNASEESTDIQETEPEESTASSSPNILLIISDDQGLDASAQYDFSDDVPNTPTLNEIAAQGITFENMWATPVCSTTRATIITGKYGINSGVEALPGNLSAEHDTLQEFLKNNEATEHYQSAVFGKWHLGIDNVEHPREVGIEHYAGNITNIDNYFNWSLTTNGISETVTDYHSSKITDLAIEWIAEQDAPWFTWLAYQAPHSPYHLPPTSLHERDLAGTENDIVNNPREYYLAAIEAMDAEIGRLLSSLDEETRDNTVIIFIGDNGTPRNIIDAAAFDSTHGKGTLFQGGVAVPFIVSGKGISRINEREMALVTSTDLFATIANVAGGIDTKIHDSQSFKSLFSSTEKYERDNIYTAYQSDDETGWTTRSANYKLITYEDESQALYNISGDFSELTNLIPTNDSNLLSIVTSLSNFSESTTGITLNESGTTNALDLTNVLLTQQSYNCVDYIEQYTSTVNDINNSVVFNGDLVISQVGDKCIFQTNAIPNHDFNDGDRAFPNDVSAQNDTFEITTSPIINTSPTAISLQVDNALMLNGVKVDLLAAGCFGIGNGKVGCNDMAQPWRYDPMHAANGFNVDSHNAHAQPDGTYHYHGSPLALFESNNNQKSPVVGFAADGFPIFGSNFDDEGTIRAATSSYRLKSGTRPSGDGEPGGSYDGAFRDDYEYVEGLGDLDECNGMTTDNGYAYYITDVYPYVLACFSGTPDSSFNK